MFCNTSIVIRHGLFSHYRPEIDFTRHVLPVLGAALDQANTQEESHAATL